MRVILKPFRMKKLNKKLSLLLKQSLDNAPVAPLEELRKEAIEFEKLIAERNSASTCK